MVTVVVVVMVAEMDGPGWMDNRKQHTTYAKRRSLVEPTRQCGKSSKIDSEERKRKSHDAPANKNTLACKRKKKPTSLAPSSRMHPCARIIRGTETQLGRRIMAVNPRWWEKVHLVRPHSGWSSKNSHGTDAFLKQWKSRPRVCFPTFSVGRCQTGGQAYEIRSF
ncbi:hypothetical protein BKA80DRAFT_146823 [Phyllosticta citrichinensis]